MTHLLQEYIVVIKPSWLGPNRQSLIKIRYTVVCLPGQTSVIDISTSFFLFMAQFTPKQKLVFTFSESGLVLSTKVRYLSVTFFIYVLHAGFFKFWRQTPCRQDNISAEWVCPRCDHCNTWIYEECEECGEPTPNLCEACSGVGTCDQCVKTPTAIAKTPVLIAWVGTPLEPRTI